MKRIFFTFIIACSTALIALPLKHSLSAQEISKQEMIQYNGALKPPIGFKTLLNNFSTLQARKESGEDHCRGPIGEIGRRGFRGPTGPTGPTGHSRGVSAAYGSFFTEESVPVDPGQPILFTRRSFSRDNVILEPNGVIQLNETGDYLVIFGVSRNGSGNDGRVALLLNGATVPGTAVTLPASVPDQLTTVAKTLRVATVPVALQVINNGSVVINLDTVQDQDITAFITVEKLHNLPTP